MKLLGFDIHRRDRVGELEKQVQTLSQQAVKVTDLQQLAQKASGQQPGVGNPAFPFGPLTPLQALGTPYEAGLGPRRWQYPVGANIQYIPRTGEQVSFAELRNFSRLYDVARICIQIRKDEIIEGDLEFHVRKGLGLKDDDVQDQIRKALAFWEKPDQMTLFDDWLGMLLEDVFTIDAPTLHKQMTLDGKDLYALNPVAGDTIHPLIDDLGKVYGYQQIIYGVPRTAYIDPDYARALPDADKPQIIFPRQQLIYRPRVLMFDSLYGFPPLEWVILTISQAIRKQLADLAYFTDGNMPDVLLPMPDGTGIEETFAFQENFNALLKGNAAQRFGVLHFLPGGIDPSKAKEFRTFSPETKWDELLFTKTLAAFGVTRQEFGFVADINRSSGQMQENLQERRSNKPLRDFIESIIDDVTHNDLHCPDITSRLTRYQNEEDELKLAQADGERIKQGASSVDEIRSKRGLGEPTGINRPFVITTNGPVFLDQALGVSAPAEPTLKEAHAEIQAAERAAQKVTPSGTLDKALGQWRENSLKRVKQGKSPRNDYASFGISADIGDQLVERLAKVTTVEEVKAAFAAPFPFDSAALRSGQAQQGTDRWAGYP